MALISSTAMLSSSDTVIVLSAALLTSVVSPFPPINLNSSLLDKSMLAWVESDDPAILNVIEDPVCEPT